MALATSRATGCFGKFHFWWRAEVLPTPLFSGVENPNLQVSALDSIYMAVTDEFMFIYNGTA